MPRVYPETFAADYSRLEKTTFTRDRMRQLRCAVIGAGALGNEVARLLGLLGAAEVLVVDPDAVEASNLPRSVFFTVAKSVGRNKAQALAATAQDLFRDTEWAAIRSEIADVGFQRLAGVSLLFSCVDSDLARLEIAYISRKLRIPVVDGGLGNRNYSRGRVTYFPAGPDYACFGCMLTPKRRRELLELWDAHVRPCYPENADAEPVLPSTPTMAGITASLAVELGLRRFFETDIETKNNTPPCSRSFEIEIHPTRRMEEFTIPVSADCPFHHCDEILSALPAEDSTFEELLNRAGGEAVILDWPVCVGARCTDCGHQWAPMLRLAALRRRGRCLACGSRHLLELDAVRVIGRDSAWRQKPPAALQLPADHLYSVQRRHTP